MQHMRSIIRLVIALTVGFLMPAYAMTALETKLKQDRGQRFIGAWVIAEGDPHTSHFSYRWYSPEKVIISESVECMQKQGR